MPIRTQIGGIQRFPLLYGNEKESKTQLKPLTRALCTKSCMNYIVITWYFLKPFKTGEIAGTDQDVVCQPNYRAAYSHKYFFCSKNGFLFIEFRNAKEIQINYNECIKRLTAPHELVVHCGHVSSSHRSVVSGFVLASQLMSLSLHSTKRVLTPEPQVTEHYK